MSDVEKNIGTHKPEFDGEWVRLGDVCAKGKSNLRQKDLKNDGPYPVYGAPGIVGFSSNYQNADAYVAVVKDGAGVGRVIACEPRSSVLGTMQALLPGKGIDRDYLLHLVRSMDLGKGFTGSTIPHIYFKDYGKTLVRALSREQQVEVANRLSGIDHLISQGKGQLSFLDDLVKSQFVEMFGDGEWTSKTIGELATDIRYGTSKKATECGKYTYLRMNNLTDDGKLAYDDVKYIDLSGDELEKCQVVDGDLLFNRTNSREKVGKTAVFHGDTSMVIAGYIIRVRLGEEMRSDYLSVFMNLSTTKAMLRSIAKGAVHQANINSKELAAIKVPVAPIELQDRFLDFVARVDKLGFDVQQQIEKLETLKQSLMQEYFG